MGPEELSQSMVKSGGMEVSVEYPGGVIDSAALVTPLGGDHYRIELQPVKFLIADSEESLESLPNYGVIIEANEIAPGVLRFVSIVERAPFKRFEFLTTVDVAESESFRAILTRVDSNGGYWDRMAGGIMFICVPEDGGYDPTEDLKQIGCSI